MKIIVSGAGIGGLTAALCFIQQGAEVTVLERAPELGDVGAGIQVPPNAMKVFENLGLDNELAKIAFRPEAIEARMGRSGLCGTNGAVKSRGRGVSRRSTRVAAGGTRRRRRRLDGPDGRRDRCAARTAAGWCQSPGKH